MPRTARIAPKDFVYHVLTRGNNKQDIFHDREDYEKYIDILQKYKEKYKFRLYHYVLMTNHVHLIIEPSGAGGSLSDIMKGINLSYAQHYKIKYNHVGHFWQDRYKSILVAKDEYLLACGGYVELNPVRAGMVKEPKEYPWSSYQATAHGKKNEVVDTSDIISNTDEARREYRKFVQAMLKNNEAMKGEMERKNIYGGEEFIRQLQGKYKLDATIKKRGRPWKKAAGIENK